MAIRWTASAQRDLARLHAFLAVVDRRAASRIVRDLYAAAQQLNRYPEIGVHLENFPSRDVRRLVVGEYELRYEIRGATKEVLNVWHVREDR